MWRGCRRRAGLATAAARRGSRTQPRPMGAPRRCRGRRARAAGALGRGTRHIRARGAAPPAPAGPPGACGARTLGMLATYWRSFTLRTVIWQSCAPKSKANADAARKPRVSALHPRRRAAVARTFSSSSVSSAILPLEGIPSRSARAAISGASGGRPGEAGEPDSGGAGVSCSRGGALARGLRRSRRVRDGGARGTPPRTRLRSDGIDSAARAAWRGSAANAASRRSRQGHHAVRTATQVTQAAAGGARAAAEERHKRFDKTTRARCRRAQRGAYASWDTRTVNVTTWLCACARIR